MALGIPNSSSSQTHSSLPASVLAAAHNFSYRSASVGITGSSSASRRAMMSLGDLILSLGETTQSLKDEKELLCINNAVLKSQVEQLERSAHAKSIDNQIVARIDSLWEHFMRLTGALEDLDKKFSGCDLNRLPDFADGAYVGGLFNGNEFTEQERRLGRLLWMKQTIQLYTLFNSTIHPIKLKIKEAEEERAATQLQLQIEPLNLPPVANLSADDLALVAELAGQEAVKEFEECKRELVELQIEQAELRMRQRVVQEAQELQEVRVARVHEVFDKVLKEIQEIKDPLVKLKDFCSGIRWSLMPAFNLSSIKKDTAQDYEYYFERYTLILDVLQAMSAEISVFIEATTAL